MKFGPIEVGKFFQACLKQPGRDISALPPSLARRMPPDLSCVTMIPCGFHLEYEEKRDGLSLKFKATLACFWQVSPPKPIRCGCCSGTLRGGSAELHMSCH